MVEVEKFCSGLKEKGIEFFTGVPDSLLKDFCAYIKDTVDSKSNIITANEGNALALASGYYLATGNPALVYMQNSGIGNAINPLASLTDELVYSIPALLLIGWRGEPGKKDEPQHKKQGLITTELLEVLSINYKVIDKETTIEEALEYVNIAIDYMNENKKPYAIVIKKEAFTKYELKNKQETSYDMNRERAIEIIVKNLDEKDIVVSTTGMASRELFEIRERNGQGHEKDFLTVGSMGHASHIGLGIALEKNNRNVYVIDGDGAFIMHMGGAAIIGSEKPENFKHIVINNGAHDSVGGQETCGHNINMPQIALACGYKWAKTVDSEEELADTIEEFKTISGPGFLEIRVKKGARKDLGRPTVAPIENKENFMKFLQ